jgi:hypothetical protein
VSAAKNHQNFCGDQGDLFRAVEQPQSVLLNENAPDLDIELELMAGIKFLRREMRKIGIVKAEQIVDRINLCLPEEKHITVRQWNAWCADSKEDHPLPAWVLPALCWALRGIAPVHVIVRALGLHVIDESEYLATELGRVVTQRGELARTERQLKSRLGVK